MTCSDHQSKSLPRGMPVRAPVQFVASRQDLRIRAQVAISRPVPKSIAQADVQAVRAYKDCVAQVAQFARTGRYADRSTAALYRLEAMQGVRQ